mgnify:CR=1 FL=1
MFKTWRLHMWSIASLSVPLSRLLPAFLGFLFGDVLGGDTERCTRQGFQEKTGFVFRVHVEPSAYGLRTSLALRAFGLLGLRLDQLRRSAPSARLPKSNPTDQPSKNFGLRPARLAAYSAYLFQGSYFCAASCKLLPFSVHSVTGPADTGFALPKKGSHCVRPLRGLAALLPGQALATPALRDGGQTGTCQLSWSASPDLLYKLVSATLSGWPRLPKLPDRLANL